MDMMYQYAWEYYHLEFCSCKSTNFMEFSTSKIRFILLLFLPSCWPYCKVPVGHSGRLRMQMRDTLNVWYEELWTAAKSIAHLRTAEVHNGYRKLRILSCCPFQLLSTLAVQPSRAVVQTSNWTSKGRLLREWSPDSKSMGYEYNLNPFIKCGKRSRLVPQLQLEISMLRWE